MKIALQTGAALVPTFTFGETDTVTVVDTRKVAWARRVQRAAKALGGFTLPFVYGSGLFGLKFGLLPHRVPIFCVVGQPIAVPHYTGRACSDPESSGFYLGFCVNLGLGSSRTAFPSSAPMGRPIAVPHSTGGPALLRPSRVGHW